jgi:ABC-2 type transport system permease protein
MLISFIKKEFIQLRRDRRILPIIFVAPVVQLIILGYAATVDVKDIITVVCDNDRSQESRDYLSSFFNNGYFFRVAELNDCEDIDKFLDRGRADAGIVIPSGFGSSVVSGQSIRVQAIISGINSNIGGIAFNYMSQINSRYSGRILIEKLNSSGKYRIPFISAEDRIFYNPELLSRYYMIPAILSLILMIMTMILTAMALVREKELGTMEQLIVTPLKSYHIIMGKLLPFIIIGLIDVALVTFAAVFWFGVPLKGSLLLLFFAALLFLMNTLGIGLFVSTVSSTQQQAMMSAMFFVMLPFVYLSGFIFPIENMPPVVQHFTYAIPLRYFLNIIRGIFLKGTGIQLLWKDFLTLGCFGIAILLMSVSRFKKTI